MIAKSFNIFRSKPIALMILGLLSSFMFSVLLGGASVHAASTSEQITGYQTMFNSRRIPQQSQTHLWMSDNTPSGSAGNFVPRLAFYVYKKGIGDVTVHINGVGFGCGSSNKFSSMKLVKVSSDKSNSPTLGNGEDISDCTSPGSTMNLTLHDPTTGSKFSDSDIYGSDYRYAIVYLKINGGESIDSITVDNIGGGDSPKLSLVGDRTGSSIDVNPDGYKYSPFAPSITLDGSTRREISLEFAPPCDASTAALTDKSVRWKDADSRQKANGAVDDNSDVAGSWDQPGPTVVTYTVRDNTGDYKVGSSGNGLDANSHPKNFFSSPGFNLNKGRQYTLTFYHVSARMNNTIQMLLPFNQTPCVPPPPSDWTVNVDSYVERGGTQDVGSSVGDVTDPNGPNAPQPNQSFRYIAKATNDDGSATQVIGTYTTGGDSYNDGTWNYLHFGFKCLAGQGYDLVPPVPCTGPLYANTGGNIKFNKKLNDNRELPVPPATEISGDGYRGYKTAIGGDLAEPWGFDWGSFTVGQGDGGRQRCVVTTISPTLGDRKSGDPYDAPDGSSPDKNERWKYSGSDGSTLCVNVPWYYTLSAALTVTGANSSTIQQGQVLTATGKISNPNTDGSRLHTQSQSKEIGVIELKLDPGQPVISNISGVPNTANYATGPCDHMKSRSGGNGLCDPQGDGDKAVGAGSSEDIAGGRNANDTSNYSVGTKLCYAAYAKHPRNTTSTEYDTGDSYYTYSDINCTIIVKSPKVHFQNTDVTVGRHRSTVNNPCSDPVNASIVTASAPTIKDDGLAGNGNMYGSWVEYGAFATGSISGFGSAATPHGFVNNAIVQPQRLTFGNDGALGNFAAYGQTLNCLPNPFEDVNDDNTTDLENLPTADAQNSFETAGANKGNLYLNELAEKTTASSDKKGYVAKGSNIRLTPRSPTTYTADVSVEAKPYLYGAECPRLNVTIYVSGVVTDSKPLDYCNDTNYETKTVTLGLGSVGYGGPSKVRLEYVNDYWTGGDRNIEVRNVTVKFNNNNTQQAHNVKDLPVSNRVYDNSYPGLMCESSGVVTAGNGLMLHQSSASSAVGKNGACYGVEILQNDLMPPIASMPPPPNLLNSAYTGFQSRDIVLYAKKADPTKKCTDVANATSGNIVIDQDIIYSRTGFNSVLQLPRLAFVADCSITISDAVREVNASLVAGDAIKTCSHQAKTKDECNQNLVVRGGISANRLLLWRTFGADLQNDDGAGTPAENFDLSPSQMIANYKRGLRSATFSTTSESDLPPRY